MSPRLTQQVPKSYILKEGLFNTRSSFAAFGDQESLLVPVLVLLMASSHQVSLLEELGIIGFMMSPRTVYGKRANTLCLQRSSPAYQLPRSCWLSSLTLRQLPPTHYISSNTAAVYWCTRMHKERGIGSLEQRSERFTLQHDPDTTSPFNFSKI